jgi:hypothetical protein
VAVCFLMLLWRAMRNIKTGKGVKNQSV